MTRGPTESGARVHPLFVFVSGHPLSLHFLKMVTPTLLSSQHQPCSLTLSILCTNPALRPFDLHGSARLGAHDQRPHDRAHDPTGGSGTGTDRRGLAVKPAQSSSMWICQRATCNDSPEKRETGFGSGFHVTILLQVGMFLAGCGLQNGNNK